jgi:hypothetical protein
MTVSHVFLDAEFEYVSRISLSPTPFALYPTMRPHTPTYVSHWGLVGGSLDIVIQANCHVSYSCDSPLQVAGQSSGCYHLSEVRCVCSTINMPRKCVNSRDAFCYICSEVTFKPQRRSFTPLIKKWYENYFGCEVGDQEKSWAPQFCCGTCARRLTEWAKDSRCMLSFLWFGESPRTILQIATSA